MVLAELAEEVGDRASPLASVLFLEGHEGVGPADHAVPGAEAGEEFLLSAEHDVVGGLGDGFEQVVLVVEVVVELAARRRRPGPDVVQAGRGRPFLGDDLAGCGDDALRGLTALSRWSAPLPWLQYPAYWT